MKLSLSAAALFAIYGQVLCQQGTGEFRIFEQNSAPTNYVLRLEGETPFFDTIGPEYETWQISQVGATSAGDKIVNIQSRSNGGYLSCSTTDEDAPCELKQSKYSIQPFVERYSAARDNTDGIYVFFDEKTEKILTVSSLQGGYLSLKDSPADNQETSYVLVRPEWAEGN